MKCAPRFLLEDKAMFKTVAELMQCGMLTVTPNTTVAELAKFFEGNRVHGAPVVDKKGKLLGVVSRSDLVKLVTTERERGSSNFHNPFYTGFVDDEDLRAVWPRGIASGKLPQTVREIMSDRLIAIAETASAGTAAALMAKEKIHRILVTREGAFVGILSASDLLRCLAAYEKSLPGLRVALS